jgi:ankyrin repeat protein
VKKLLHLQHHTYALVSIALSFVLLMTILVNIVSGQDEDLKRNASRDLLDATRSGDMGRVKALIAANADVNIRNAEGITALMVATFDGQTEIAQTLLAANADVNARDNNGFTALIGASIRGHIELVRVLLAAKADVNIKNKFGATALMFAEDKGHTEIARMLKTATRKKARSNQGNKSGMIVDSSNNEIKFNNQTIRPGMTKAEVSQKVIS